LVADQDVQAPALVGLLAVVRLDVHLPTATGVLDGRGAAAGCGCSVGSCWVVWSWLTASSLRRSGCLRPSKFPRIVSANPTPRLSRLRNPGSHLLWPAPRWVAPDCPRTAGDR
jgi:hypothetical protein